mmetsp:Transcript_6698/g.20285  ORF Transcript_6698/g.20285 Transcript_6698/m.20285 type:complete len:791 (+) Transcript_6698:123-2495(+)
MRIMIKGGVWKNSEDEILKAAVMKYGKNQWARISSLLVRKSAKQCKARWYEWLDPSIQKTEWTREEEEKLLHLAKIMPTQWRTIAPIVGRTAAQCLEHYEKLLDQAQKVEEEEAEGGDGIDVAGKTGGEIEAAFDDPRRLRPGEIDPTPETKPARPDPVDMDEDEKEMLSEARARLANTRGKKAKRKAREKQLDEAKRLAHLQKRRELLAAGIRVRTFRKGRKDMDYTKEVPFEKKPAPGFYDTSEEDIRARKERLDTAQVGKLLEKYEGKRRDDVEALERKRDERRRKVFEDKDLPAALAAEEKKQEETPFRRSKLSLPQPRVSDVELEAVVKSGSASSLARAAVGSGSTATKDLITDYTPSPAQTPVARTGTNVESWDEVRSRELANLRAYHGSSSALAGGENTPVVDSDFSGVTPKRKVASTPNPWATPATSSASTPALPPISTSAVTPRSVTRRDGLRINALEMEASEKARFDLLKRELVRGLNALPEAKNDYKVVVDDAAHVPAEEEEKDDGTEMVEDALDTELRAKKEVERKLNELRRRFLSDPARRGLPRPTEDSVKNVVALSRKRGPEDEAVAVELLAVFERDEAVLAALQSQADPADLVENAYTAVGVEAGDDEAQLVRARRMVGKVASKRFRTNGITPDVDEVFDSVHRGFLYAFDEGGHPAPLAVDGGKAAMDIWKGRLKQTKVKLKGTEKQVGKSEKRTSMILGGYEMRRQKLQTELSTEFERLQSAKTELSCFQNLQDLEAAAIPGRLEAARELLDREERREEELQARYQRLAESSG